MCHLCCIIMIGPLPVDDLRKLSKAALYHANSLSLENISKLFSVLASQSHSDKRVLSRYCERLGDFRGCSPRDLAIILNSLVRLAYVDRSVFESASQFLQGLGRNEFVSERDLGLIHNAYARAGIADIKLFEALCPRVRDQLGVLSPQSAGNICHAYGKLGISFEIAKSLLIEIATQVCRERGKRAASSQELSNILYSLGNLDICEMSVISPLLKLVTEKLSRFNPVELAALVTALCKLGISDKPLMRLTAKRAESPDCVAKFSPYEITAILHAFSQLDVNVPKRLFLEIAPPIFSRTAFNNSHSACITFCAYSRVGICVPASLSAVLVPLILTENDPQYLVNVLFALGNQDTVLSGSVVGKLLDRGFPLNPINLVQVLYSTSRLPGAEKLHVFTRGECLARVSEFAPSQLSNILYALRKSPSLDLFEAIASRAREFVPQLSPQLRSSVAESTAIIAPNSDKMWTPIAEALRAPQSWDLVSLSALSNSARLTNAMFARVFEYSWEPEFTDFLQLLCIVKHSSLDVPPRLHELLYTQLREGLDDITQSELMELVRLMRSVSLEIPTPFDSIEILDTNPQVPLFYTPPSPSGPSASQYMSTLLVYSSRPYSHVLH